MRLSYTPAARALNLLRWSLMVIGGAAVMWMGAALLATPASAAAIVPVAASQGLTKAGKERPSGLRLASSEGGDGETSGDSGGEWSGDESANDIPSDDSEQAGTSQSDDSDEQSSKADEDSGQREYSDSDDRPEGESDNRNEERGRTGWNDSGREDAERTESRADNADEDSRDGDEENSDHGSREPADGEEIAEKVRERVPDERLGTNDGDNESAEQADSERGEILRRLSERADEAAERAEKDGERLADEVSEWVSESAAADDDEIAENVRERVTGQLREQFEDLPEWAAGLAERAGSDGEEFVDEIRERMPVDVDRAADLAEGADVESDVREWVAGLSGVDREHDGERLVEPAREAAGIAESAADGEDVESGVREWVAGLAGVDREHGGEHLAGLVREAAERLPGDAGWAADLAERAADGEDVEADVREWVAGLTGADRELGREGVDRERSVELAREAVGRAERAADGEDIEADVREWATGLTGDDEQLGEWLRDASDRAGRHAAQWVAEVADRAGELPERLRGDFAELREAASSGDRGAAVDRALDVAREAAKRFAVDVDWALDLADRAIEREGGEAPVRNVVDRFVDAATEVLSTGDPSDGSGLVQKLRDEFGAAVLASSSEKKRSRVDDGEKLPPVDGPDENTARRLCESMARCGDLDSLRSELASTMNARGPPSGDGHDGWDDAAQVEKALEGRINKDTSAAELEESRKQAAAGRITADELAKRETAHNELAAKADEDKARLSEYRAEQIDEVVDGHRDISTRESALAAAEAKMGADEYARSAAQLEQDRQKLYRSTDELRAAANRDRPQGVPGDAPQDGSAAGCGSSGVFVECGSVTDRADGETERDRCVALAGVSSGCGASTGSEGNKAAASCTLSGTDKACGSNASYGENKAEAWCSLDGGDCDQSSRAGRNGAGVMCETDTGACRGSTSAPTDEKPTDLRASAAVDCTGGCDVHAVAGRSGAEVSCRSAAGACQSNSTGSKNREAAAPSTVGADTRSAAGSANCTAATGGCATKIEVELGHEAYATADVTCGRGATDCKGAAATDTKSGSKATVTTPTPEAITDTPAPTVEVREAATGGAANCTVTNGGCEASSGARVHVAQAAVKVDCDTKDCTGTGATASNGKVTADTAGRETTSGANCTATGGDCDTESSTTVGDKAGADKRPVAARVLTADSTATARVDCDSPTCTGTGATETTGGASGDITGIRDSKGSANCAADVGECTATSGTEVINRAASKTDPTAVSGPVSVSTASSTIKCAGGNRECGGNATAATSARDTAITPDARGTSSSAGCTVSGGECTGQAGSKASSAPDFQVLDPASGKPLAGQPLTGPTSTSSSDASITCVAGAACSGSVRTTTTAFEGGAAPRTSEGTATCVGGTGGCNLKSVSNASSGPGAALAFAGKENKINAARLPAGPSAASAAGAALVCEGAKVCDGKVGSSATATDPSVSPDPRGSRSEGACDKVSGAVCQAVTNSGASTGPDANVIVPVVQAKSTADATVKQEQTGERSPVQPGKDEQPADPPAPTAPGSSANAGGPTAPGASSWSMANATLDCVQGTTCAGTASSAAAGADGPANVTGANGARGPPEDASTSSGSCSGTGGCQVQTSSTAGAGQVVADIAADRQNKTAEALAEQAKQAERDAKTSARIAAAPGATDEQKKRAADAVETAKQTAEAAKQAAELAKKPVTGAPATMSDSTAAAKCTTPGCTATTTADVRLTVGVSGTSHVDATCTAGATGCGVLSSAVSTLARTSGLTGDDERPLPGRSAQGRTSSQVVCPDAGCTGSATGTANGSIGNAASTSTATTRCAGTAKCMAGVGTGVTANAARGTSAISTSADVDCRTTEVPCDGTAGSRTAAPGFTARTTCTAKGTCGVDSGVTVAGRTVKGVVVSAKCQAAQCAATAEARGAGNTASAETACTAGTAECGGVVKAGVGPGYATAGALCAGPDTATCRYSFGAHSSASSASPGNQATAKADGVGSGTFGGGEVTTSANAQTGKGMAAAGASCQGTGVRCSHSYSASSSASAKGAKASASGSGRGGIGGGAVMTTAQASSGPGWASASASCSGAANCRHSYSASVSASASWKGANPDDPKGWGRSVARASASGSGGGGQGGGGVSVSARASAGPGYANASSSCTGAANCKSSQYAHSEMHSTLETPAGTWNAKGGKTCTGGGNGSCAVTARAKAGPGGFGDGTCTGTGKCVDSSTGNVFIPVRKEIPGSDQDPLKALDDALKLGPGQRGFGAKIDGDRVVVRILNPDGSVGEMSCTGCVNEQRTFEGGDGQKVEYTPGKGFVGSNLVQSGDARKDTGEGSHGLGLIRDKAGRGQGSVLGTGELTDGVSGHKVRYTNSTPRPPGEAVGAPPPHTNKTAFTPVDGSTPFTTSCNGGCVYKAPRPVHLGAGHGDELEAFGPSGTIIGRGADGRAGTFDLTGGALLKLAENDRVQALGGGPNGDEGRVYARTRDASGGDGLYMVTGQRGQILLREGVTVSNAVPGKRNLPDGVTYQLMAETPDGKGAGGKVACTGECVITKPGGDWRENFRCELCHVDEQLAGGKGPRGAAGWAFARNLSDGKISRFTKEGDEQSCSGFGCAFTQFNRDANGNGGGAVCSTGGSGGQCRGVNREGDWTQCDGIDCRTGLLYRNYNDGKLDGTRVGAYCEALGGRGACQGPPGTTWFDYDADPNALQVMNRNGDYRLTEDLAKDLAKVPGLGRDPNDRSPLSDRQIETLNGTPEGKAALGRYRDGLTAPTDVQSAAANLGILEDKSIERRRAPQVAAAQPKIKQLEDHLARANADNKLTAAEKRQASKLRADIEAGAPGLLDEWGPARARLDSDRSATWTRPKSLAAAAEAVANNPAVIKQLAGDGPMSDDERKVAAINRIVTEQEQLEDAKQALYTETVRGRAAIEDRMSALNAEINAINGRGGPTRAEQRRVQNEEAAIKAAGADLDRRLQPLRDRVDGESADLRKIDVVLAANSGHLTTPGADGSRKLNYGEQVRDADAGLSGLENQILAMRNSRDPNQRALAGELGTLHGWQKLHYGAVRDQPMPYSESFLAGIRMPSTGLPDFTYAQAATVNGPRINQYLRQNNEPLAKAWAKLPPDERAALAAYGTVDWAKDIQVQPKEALRFDPAAAVADYMSDRGRVERVLDIANRSNAADPGNIGGAALLRYRLQEAPGSGYVRYLSDPNLDLAEYAAWTRHLGPEDRARVGADLAELRPSWIERKISSPVRTFFTTAGERVGSPFLNPESAKDFATTTGNLAAALPSLVDSASTDVTTLVKAGFYAATFDGDGLVSVLPTGGWDKTLPTIAGMIRSGNNSINRWLSGSWREDYASRPFSTFVEDASTVTMFTYPVGKLIYASAASKFSAVAKLERQVGFRPGTFARMNAGDHVVPRTAAQGAAMAKGLDLFRKGTADLGMSRALGVPMTLMALPLRPYLAAPRVLASGLGKATGTIADGLQNYGGGKKPLAAFAAQAARPVRAVSDGATFVGDHGVIGSVRTRLAYAEFGLKTSASRAKLDQAYRDAEAGLLWSSLTPKQLAKQRAKLDKRYQAASRVPDVRAAKLSRTIQKLGALRDRQGPQTKPASVQRKRGEVVAPEVRAQVDELVRTWPERRDRAEIARNDARRARLAAQRTRIEADLNSPRLTPQQRAARADELEQNRSLDAELTRRNEEIAEQLDSYFDATAPTGGVAGTPAPQPGAGAAAGGRTGTGPQQAAPPGQGRNPTSGRSPPPPMGRADGGAPTPLDIQRGWRRAEIEAELRDPNLAPGKRAALNAELQRISAGETGPIKAGDTPGEQPPSLIGDGGGAVEPTGAPVPFRTKVRGWARYAWTRVLLPTLLGASRIPMDAVAPLPDTPPIVRVADDGARGSTAATGEAPRIRVESGTQRGSGAGGKQTPERQNGRTDLPNPAIRPRSWTSDGEPTGAIHFRVRPERPTSPDEQVRPAHIDETAWQHKTSAQRAEELSAFGDDQRAGAEEAGADAQALRRLADLAEGEGQWLAYDRLVERADQAEAAATAARKLAGRAFEFAALHEKIAKETGKGRRELARYEGYRANGTTSTAVAGAIWHAKLVRALQKRGVDKVVLAQLDDLPVGDGGMPRLAALLYAGIGEDGNRTRAAVRTFANENGLGWSDRVLVGVLEKLPTTWKAAQKVAAAPAPAPERSAIATVAKATALAAVSGFFAAGAGTPLALLAGAGVGMTSWLGMTAGTDDPTGRPWLAAAVAAGRVTGIVVGAALGGGNTLLTGAGVVAGAAIAAYRRAASGGGRFGIGLLAITTSVVGLGGLGGGGSGGGSPFGTLGDALGGVPLLLPFLVAAMSALVLVHVVRTVRARGPPLGVEREATARDVRWLARQMIVGPRGVLLAADGDRLRARGWYLRADAGDFVIVVHTDALGFYVATAGGGKIRLQAEQLAELLNALPEFQRKRDRVRVVVPGCGCAVELERLQRALNTVVVAPTADVLVHHENGRSWITLDEGGRWLQADGTGPVVEVPAPLALTVRERTRGSKRLGPPGVASPFVPRGPPVRAGGDQDRSVVFGPAGAELAAQVARVMPALLGVASAARLRVRGGPEVRLILIDDDRAEEALGDLHALPRRMIAHRRADGRVVMFREMLTDLHELTKAGEIPASWWEQLVAGDAADVLTGLPMPAKVKLVLGPALWGTVDKVADRLGVTPDEVVAAAATWDRLGVADGLVVRVPRKMHGLKMPDRPVPGDQAWATRLSSAPRFPNLQPTSAADEQATADATGVIPVRVGTPEAEELMAAGGMLSWVLRPDGSLWVNQRFGEFPDGSMDVIKHSVTGGGRPVLAAGEAWFARTGDSIVGVNLDLQSGHYHGLNEPEQNRRLRDLAFDAFARHGIRFPFTMLTADDHRFELDAGGSTAGETPSADHDTGRDSPAAGTKASPSAPRSSAVQNPGGEPVDRLRAAARAIMEVPPTKEWGGQLVRARAAAEQLLVAMGLTDRSVLYAEYGDKLTVAEIGALLHVLVNRELGGDPLAGADAGGTGRRTAPGRPSRPRFGQLPTGVDPDHFAGLIEQWRAAHNGPKAQRELKEKRAIAGFVELLKGLDDPARVELIRVAGGPTRDLGSRLMAAHARLVMSEWKQANKRPADRQRFVERLAELLGSMDIVKRRQLVEEMLPMATRTQKESLKAIHNRNGWGGRVVFLIGLLLGWLGISNSLMAPVGDALPLGGLGGGNSWADLAHFFAVHGGGMAQLLLIAAVPLVLKALGAAWARAPPSVRAVPGAVRSLAERSEARVYLPIVPVVVLGLVGWLVDHSALAALLLPLVAMFPHAKLHAPDGRGVLAYLKNLRWERAWMFAVPLALVQVPVLSWTVTSFLVFEIAGALSLLFGLLSTSMNKGWREEAANREKYPLSLVPDVKILFVLNVFGLRIAFFPYHFDVVGPGVRPMPGVPAPKVTGWRLWQRIRYWLGSYYTGSADKQLEVYTFWQVGIAIGVGDTWIAEYRRSAKEAEATVHERELTLDFLLGPGRQLHRFVFWVARGLARLVPGAAGRWLRGVPERRIARSFVQRMNHAQRMLVWTLAELAWQRERLGTVRSERDRARLRAAIAENEQRAAEIRTTIAALPGEFLQRMQARNQAQYNRAQAKLKRPAAGVATNRRLRLRAELIVTIDRIRLAARDIVAPQLHRGPHLERASERSRTRQAQLRAALAELDAALAVERSAKVRANDRIRGLLADRAAVRALLAAAKNEGKKLDAIPGAAQPAASAPRSRRSRSAAVVIGLTLAGLFLPALLGFAPAAAAPLLATVATTTGAVPGLVWVAAVVVAVAAVRTANALVTIRGPPSAATFRRAALAAAAAAVFVLGGPLSAQADVPSGAQPGATSVVVVQPGDTLGKIATRLGISKQALVEANADRFPTRRSQDRIRAGETLELPAPAAPLPAQKAEPTPSSTEPATPQPATASSPRWRMWLGGGVVVLGLLALARWRASVKRGRAWAKQRAAWRDVEPGRERVSGAVALMEWLLRKRAAGRHAGRVSELRADVAGDPRLAAFLAGQPDGDDLDRVLADLVATGMVRVVLGRDGDLLVPTGVFAELLARAPPDLLGAMGRNLAAVIGAPDLTTPDVMAAVLDRLRDGVWAAEAAWGSRGATAAGTKQLYAPTRAAARAYRAALAARGRLLAQLEALKRIEQLLRARLTAKARASARWRAAVGSPLRRLVTTGPLLVATVALHLLTRELPADLRRMAPEAIRAALLERAAAVAASLADLRDAEARAAVAASHAAAAAGVGREQAEQAEVRAREGVRRFIPAVVGLLGAFPGQATSVASIAGMAIAAALGVAPTWVATQGANAAIFAAAVGLVAALLGDRLIRTMRPMAVIGAAGTLALLVLGLAPASGLLLPALAAIGAMGTAGALAQGRMERYHPVAAELKDQRNGSKERANRVLALVFPLAVTGSIEAFGVPVTLVAMSAVAAALTVLALLVLRGQNPDLTLHEPPSPLASVKAYLMRVVATPRGLLRAVMSISMITLLTGLPGFLIGGAIVDTMVRISDPLGVLGTIGVATGVIAFVRGIVTIMAGNRYTPFKQLVARRGAPARLFSSKVVVDDEQQSRLLRAVTLLPLLLVLPAALYALAPNVVMVTVLLTAASVVVALARRPLGQWDEGPTGASLSIIAKTGSFVVGSKLLVLVVGATVAAVGVGSAVEALVAVAHVVARDLLWLTIASAAVTAVVGHLAARLRLGTLDELGAVLVGIGADPGTASRITGALGANGLKDIGSVRALLQAGAWTPWYLRSAGNWRQRLVAALGLEPHEIRLLHKALDEFMREREARGPRGPRGPPAPGNGTAGPLGDLDDADRTVLGQAFENVWTQVNHGRRAGRVINRRNDPVGARLLRDREVLLVVSPELLLEALANLGVDPERATRILASFEAFGWRNERGLGLIGMLDHRFAELGRLGLLGQVVEHEREFHLSGRAHTDAEHRADVQARLAVIRSATTPTAALSDGLTADEQVVVMRAAWLLAARRLRGTSSGTTRDGEMMLVVRTRELVDALVEFDERLSGDDGGAVESIVRRLHLVGIGQAGGVVVITEDRLAELSALAVLDDVLEQRRRALTGGPHAVDMTALNSRIAQAAHVHGPLVRGEASTLGRSSLDDGQRVAARFALARAQVEERLPAGADALAHVTGGLGRAEFQERGCAGVCVVTGLYAQLRRAGGPVSLVAWSAEDGWIHLDQVVYDALVAGRLGAAQRRELFEYHLDRVHDQRPGNRAPMRYGRLPDLMPLNATLRTVAPGDLVGVGFRETTDGHGRPVWQAPVLPTRPHPLAERTVRVEARHQQGAVSGTAWIHVVRGTRMVLVTARHVVDSPELGPPTEIVVETPWGAMLGTTRPRPTAALADGFEGDLDVAVVDVVDPRLSDHQLAPVRIGAPARHGLVALLGHPDTELMVDDGRVLPRSTRRLVASAALVHDDGTARAFFPGGELGALYVGNGAVGPGHSGGPVVGISADGHAGDPVVHGVVVRIGAADVLPGRAGREIVVVAIGAAALRAFLIAGDVPIGPEHHAGPLGELTPDAASARGTYGD
ncbi:LysM peptidoglycan-binding domain-containing protein [Actinomycetes bacterium KLBMP 9759]